MKDILVLLLLLNVHTTKVYSQPYRVDSDGNCRNSTTEYLFEPDGLKLCCKKCPPGKRLIQHCSETTDTECDHCPAGQYMEGWNYAPNCFSCTKCKRTKGLQDAQSCSSTTGSKCVCQAGMYCIMGFDDPFCTACSRYRQCKAGYGVSVPGTGKTDVKCVRCPDGMFSNTSSYTEPCQPHTNCNERVVVKKGDATSDTICQPESLISNMPPQTSTKQPRTEIVFTTRSTAMSTESKTSRGPTDSTLSVSTPVSEGVFNYSTKVPPPIRESDSMLAVVIPSVIGVILLLIFITVILLLLRKRVLKKDSTRFHPKVDANGNCESGEKISPDYLGETELTSFTITSPEQQCLLQAGEGSSDHSQCSNNTETLMQPDGCSSQESIGPLQSTVALHDPHSALSEPMSLHSNQEPITPQPSVSTQASSQSTSPQVISPITTSPHVNVNITFHIGNGSCGTPSSVTPTDLMQVDSKLPFGEEEETFSIPQQEDGKQSLMSVQESESYST